MPRTLESFGVDLLVDCNSLTTQKGELPQSTSQKVPTPDTLPISSTYSGPSVEDIPALLAFRFRSFVRLSRERDGYSLTRITAI